GNMFFFLLARAERNELGAVIKHKARLQGIDFEEVFALVARMKGGQRVVVGVYVDDMLIIGESDKEMKKEFEMTDLGSKHMQRNYLRKQGWQISRIQLSKRSEALAVMDLKLIGPIMATEATRGGR
ncbi:hypothetical protein ACJX0J_012824, partial [Zea mays]